MAVRLPELRNLNEEGLPKPFDSLFKTLKGFVRELGLTLEQEFDRVEGALDTSTNLTTEGFVTVTADYVAGQRSVILVDTSAGNVEVTLPDPTEVVRSEYVIKKITSGTETLSVVADGGANIDGASSYSTAATTFPTVRVFSDGTQYWSI